MRTNQQVNRPPVRRFAEPEREPMVFLVCGETGVGKTYRNKLEILNYMRSNPATGKIGRKALAFDTNDDDYQYKTVSPDHLKSLVNVQARRIRPFNTDGSSMDDDQKRGVVSKILRHFRDGLIILDDIDHYMSNARGQSMIGALCTNRHKGIDILLTHQSIAKITTTEWQACAWLRLHHQVDDITRYKERIPKYYLVRIGQLIVDEQYNLASDAFAAGLIDDSEFAKRKSFFIYVNIREKKIRGCSRAAFIRSAKKYIDQEESKKIRMMLNETDFKDKPLYKTRNAAITKLISEYLRYHEQSVINPMMQYMQLNK